MQRLTPRRGLAGAALAVALLCAGACAPPAPPHIVLFTADTLRADHLSHMGYARDTSPRLAAFAGDAWDFRQAITVIPKTAPAFATLFTGRHPQEHGVGANFTPVPDALPMLAEQLAAAGYRTAAFVSNPALRRENGFDRGFERFAMFAEGDGTARVGRAFLAFAAEPWEQPTFAWIHTIDPHGPYEPPPRYATLFRDDALALAPERVPGGYAVDPERPNKVLGAVPRYQQRADGEDRIADYVARYDAEIRHVDDTFGAVLDALRDRGLLDGAAVVFTSDHGESLGEHDYYFEHGWYAYEPGLRIPLVVKAPGQRRGRRVEAPVSLLDLLPTLLGLAGLPVPGDLSGVDLLRAAPPDAPILVESSDRYPEKYHGARSAGWKYLRREGDGREELYDLRADPGETRNLSDAEPDRRERLSAFVAGERERLRTRAVTPTPRRPDDPETVERLRELGYVE